jgi:hypothetical protein
MQQEETSKEMLLKIKLLGEYSNSISKEAREEN